ncbi:hypothetical protein LXA43DRAFT_1102461 [Ganoderma leucocontextum]|nr:hypothetical protein LXA43DRAFT_1102461 [Ganoderma leucocontextum]
MPLKRQLSQPSPAASPARKVPRLITVDIPLSPDPISGAPTVVSPSDTEHVPSPPPSSAHPYYPVTQATHYPISQSNSLQGLQPEELVARLDEMAAQYDQAVDEVGAEIVELQRQLGIARGTSSSQELGSAPPYHAVSRSSSSLGLQSAELVARLEEVTDRYDQTVDEAGAAVLKLQRQLGAAHRRLEASPSFEAPPWRSSSRPVSWERTALQMVDHGYSLRSGGPVTWAAVPQVAAVPLSEEQEALLLRATLHDRGGLCSTRPAPQKFKASSGLAIPVDFDHDPFGSSDLSELEDSESTKDPDPQPGSRKRCRRGHHRSEDAKQKEIRAGRVRLARKAVAAAQMAINTVHLQKFAMEKAVTYKMLKDPSQVECEESVATVLDGDSPQRVVSADGYDVLYRIPGACRGKSLDYVSGLCNDWGHVAKIKKSTANDKKGGYKRTRGALVGTTRLCTLWHAIGHKCDDPTPASDILHSGKTFRAAVDAISGLDMVSAYVMAALEAIDPTQHSLLETLWRKTCEKEKVQQLFDSINGGLAYEGREVVFNRWSDRHWDAQDPHWAWTNILYFGTFTQAQLRFPQINVTVMLHPGDMVFFHGRDLCHEALDWGRGMTCASQKAKNVQT